MEPLLMNPPASDLGRVNTILTGRARQYGVREFPGPLSIKSVVSGSAVWKTSAGEFELDPGSTLLLNAEQRYSLTIDSTEPVETFCIFFREGFVEDAARVARASTEQLLDDPALENRYEFREEICPAGGALACALERGRRTGDVFPAAEAIAGLRRLPAVKLSTRDELLRRVYRGRDYMEANLPEPLRLTDVARVACLSPFHFHRTFRAVFGETPHQYLLDRRLQRALARVRASEESITTIAVASGFSTPSSFTAAFRQRFGHAPGTFRRIATAPAHAARQYDSYECSIDGSNQEGRSRDGRAASR